MARKDRPYLPLYIQDILTDEKLIECSAQAHGVYLRLMCILHKQEKYGLLCLKQKYKQNESKFENFASMLARQMPFAQEIIQTSLQELAEEGVISIDGETLFQKRMVRDGELSLVRAEIGKTGGSNVTKQYGKCGFLYWIGDYALKNKIGVSVNIINRLYRLRSDLKLKKLSIIDSIEVSDMGKAEDAALLFFNKMRDGEWVILSHEDMDAQFALLKANIEANGLATNQANADIEIENENIDRIIKQLESLNKIQIEELQKNLYMFLVVEMARLFTDAVPEYFFDRDSDYSACLQIAYNIAEMKKWSKAEILNGKMTDTLESWKVIISFVNEDKWLNTRSLSDLSTPKEWQRLVLKMKNKEKNGRRSTSTTGKEFIPD